MFSLQLGFNNTQSSIWLGGYSTSLARTFLQSQYTPEILQNTTDDGLSELIAWTPILNSNYWSSKVNSVTVNNSSVPFTVKGVIYDSGASLIYMPSSDFKGLMAKVTEGKTCTTDSLAKTYCPCTSINDTSYPSVVI